MSDKSTNDKKLHTVNITDQVYHRAKSLVQKKGGTFTDFVNDTLSSYIDRDRFVKMYAPHITEDYVSNNAIYLNDLKLNKTAIVILKEYPDSDLENSGFYAFCEICESDSCIHVRHVLATGSILKLSTLYKMA
ncbi:MAG TPA: hypothetical protein VD815_09980 [Candidatus Saccharimonadales bacterium]|nr:hypothetical protein [Candidatus Saccharimonadales bacterium]